MKSSASGSTRVLWIALGIFALAFAVRLVHLYEIRSAPFFTLLMGDSRSYDEWARRIAAGDWIGRDVFYQAPLYPYFLGIIYRVAGRDLFVVRVVEAAIGSLSCALLFLAGRRLFSQRAGIAAGVILALWAPAIFFDGLIQKSVLDVFFVCVILYLLSQTETAEHAEFAEQGKSRRPRRAPRALRFFPIWLALGLALGALALTRENALVFVVVIAAWAAFVSRDGRRFGAQVLLAPGLVLLGLALVLGPVAARNDSVGGGFYVTTSQFGPNLYIGNHEGADGTYTALRYGRGAPEYERQDATELAEHATGRQLTPAEVSDYWSTRAIDFMTGHPSAWLALMGRKFALLWNATEMVDTESQETYAEWSWPLRILGPIAHFGVLVPLALFGIILIWKARSSAVTVLLVLTAAYAASVLLFYVFARYRYPLVPFLILFAAAGLVRAPEVFATVAHSDARQRRSVFAAAAAIAAATIFANWPIVPRAWMRAVSENNIGVALQADRRFDEAADHLRRAVSLRPDYAPAYSNLGSALRSAGRVDDAIAAYRRALDVQPDFPDAQYNLANALMDKGDADEAIARFESALRSIPGSADAHNNLGIALAARGRTDDAEREFQSALQADPQSAVAHRNLGDVLATRGDRAAAVEHLRQAIAIDPANGEAQYDLGSVLLESGDAAGAESAFRAAVQRMPASAEARNNLGIALGSQGRFDEAIAQFQQALRLKPRFADAENNLRMATAAKRGGIRR